MPSLFFEGNKPEFNLSNAYVVHIIISYIRPPLRRYCRRYRPRSYGGYDEA